MTVSCFSSCLFMFLSLSSIFFRFLVFSSSSFSVSPRFILFIYPFLPVYSTNLTPGVQHRLPWPCFILMTLLLNYSEPGFWWNLSALLREKLLSNQVLPGWNLLAEIVWTGAGREISFNRCMTVQWLDSHWKKEVIANLQIS